MLFDASWAWQQRQAEASPTQLKTDTASAEMPTGHVRHQVTATSTRFGSTRFGPRRIHTHHASAAALLARPHAPSALRCTRHASAGESTRVRGGERMKQLDHLCAELAFVPFVRAVGRTQRDVPAQQCSMQQHNMRDATRCNIHSAACNNKHVGWMEHAA